MFMVAYLTKVKITDQNVLLMIPEDNLNKYLYVRGHLVWAYLVRR
jgi:hypothetical protein